MEIAEIRKRRMAIGLSQVELARAAKVSYRTILRFEKGQQIRSAMEERILAALKAFEVAGKRPSNWWKCHCGEEIS